MVTQRKPTCPAAPSSPHMDSAGPPRGIVEQTQANGLAVLAGGQQTRSHMLAHGTPGGTMTLRFVGKDPDSPDGQSPTVWDDGDTFVIQGWRLDAATMAEVGEVPAHETVIRFPKRMIPFLTEGSTDGGTTA